jgi:hypothetical protein
MTPDLIGIFDKFQVPKRIRETRESTRARQIEDDDEDENENEWAYRRNGNAQLGPT